MINLRLWFFLNYRCHLPSQNRLFINNSILILYFIHINRMGGGLDNPSNLQRGTVCMKRCARNAGRSPLNIMKSIILLFSQEFDH